MLTSLRFAVLFCVTLSTSSQKCDKSQIPIVENGSIANGSSSVGTELNVTCDLGFTLSGEGIAVCGSNLTWTLKAQCLNKSQVSSKHTILNFEAINFSFFIKVEADQRRLIRAAFQGDQDLFRHLLDLGHLDVDAMLPRMNLTALMLASMQGFPETARMLLDAGADVNIETASGRSALLFAAEGRTKRHTKVAQILLERGADIEAEDVNGDRAISHSVRAGSLATFAVLVSKKANLHFTNKAGCTLVALAERYHRVLIASHLSVKGVSRINCREFEADGGLSKVPAPPLSSPPPFFGAIFGSSIYSDQGDQWDYEPANRLAPGG